MLMMAGTKLGKRERREYMYCIRTSLYKHFWSAPRASLFRPSPWGLCVTISRLEILPIRTMKRSQK